MKRIFLTISLLATVILSAAAQDTETAINYLKAAGPARITFTMSGTGLDGSTFSSQEGTMDLQYPDFVIEAAGHKVYCRDNVLWLYNPATAEVVIMDNMTNAMFKDVTVSKDAEGRYTADFNNGNSSRMKFVIKQVVPMEKWDGSYFSLNTDTLSDDVIVTDMRDK